MVCWLELTEELCRSRVANVKQEFIGPVAWNLGQKCAVASFEETRNRSESIFVFAYLLSSFSFKRWQGRELASHAHTSVPRLGPTVGPDDFMLERPHGAETPLLVILMVRKYYLK